MVSYLGRRDHNLIFTERYRSGHNEAVLKTVWGSRPTWVRIPLSPPTKKELLSTKSSFLFIQAAGLAYHHDAVVDIISPCGAVSHHAPACIFLRLDDIHGFAVIKYVRVRTYRSKIKKALYMCYPSKTKILSIIVGRVFVLYYSFFHYSPFIRQDFQ